MRHPPRRPALLALALLLASGCAARHPGKTGTPVAAGAPPPVLRLDGDWAAKPAALAPANLYDPAADDHDWETLAVPGNWHSQGKDYDGAVWMRRRFRVEALPPETRAFVVFRGVDYAADVWLNGTYLGFHEGYFEPFEFPAGSALRPGENLLAVRVDSPIEDPLRAWSLHKRLIKGVLAHHDTRPGGAWSPRGQEQNTGGIWAPVYLRFTGPVAIALLRAAPEVAGATPLRQGEEATVLVDIAVDNAGPPRTAEVAVDIAAENFTPDVATGGSMRSTLDVPSGRSTIRLRVPIAGAHLWWPAEHGRPDLYRAAATVTLDGRVSDTAAVEVGLRTVDLTSPAEEWLVNGRRMFVRGTNYIPSQWLAEMTAERYATDLDLMQAAHINAVRVHALIVGEEFYRACDRRGMLILQDFPLQWGYTDDPAFTREALRQTADMVDALGNHPSIAMWSMHNEPPWAAEWMRGIYPDFDPEQNRALDQALAAGVRSADGTRPVRTVSSTAEHPWFGWYRGTWRDAANRAETPMVLEYGAQALPDLASLRRIFPAAQLWPDDEADWKAWEYHNFQRRETFEKANVPMGRTIEELIHNTQSYQAHLIQFAAEAYRRQRFDPVTAIFQFMFVEDWPSANWGVVDYWRHPKPGYYALARAYQPVLPSIASAASEWEVGEDGGVELWAVNDLWRDFPGASLAYELSCDGRIAAAERVRLDLPADSGRRIAAVPTAAAPAGNCELRARIESAEGAILGENEARFRVRERGNGAR